MFTQGLQRDTASRVELATAHFSATQTAGTWTRMPLAPHAVQDWYHHARRKETRAASCSAIPCAIAVHEIGFLTSRMFRLNLRELFQILTKTMLLLRGDQ